MDSLQQHVNMLESSLKSSILNDDDRVHLFDLLIENCHPTTGCRIIDVLVRFSETYPALYMDRVRQYFEANPDADVLMIFRQLDDPEVDDEAVSRTIIELIQRCRANGSFDSKQMSMILPMVIPLRRGALVLAQDYFRNNFFALDLLL